MLLVLELFLLPLIPHGGLQVKDVDQLGIVGDLFVVHPSELQKQQLTALFVRNQVDNFEDTLQVTQLRALEDLVPKVKIEIQLIVGVDLLEENLKRREVPELLVEVAVEVGDEASGLDEEPVLWLRILTKAVRGLHLGSFPA